MAENSLNDIFKIKENEIEDTLSEIIEEGLSAEEVIIEYELEEEVEIEELLEAFEEYKIEECENCFKLNKEKDLIKIAGQKSCEKCSENLLY